MSCAATIAVFLIAFAVSAFFMFVGDATSNPGPWSVVGVLGFLFSIGIGFGVMIKREMRASQVEVSVTQPTQRRQHIPRWVKAHLFQECGGVCAGCLDTFRQIGNMQVDHIIPVHLGGNNELANLQLLCRSCNVKKGTKTMPELIEQLRRDGVRR